MGKVEEGDKGKGRALIEKLGRGYLDKQCKVSRDRESPKRDDEQESSDDDDDASLYVIEKELQRAKRGVLQDSDDEEMHSGEENDKFDIDNLPDQSNASGPPYKGPPGWLWESALASNGIHPSSAEEAAKDGVLEHRDVLKKDIPLHPSQFLDVGVWPEERRRDRFYPPGVHHRDYDKKYLDRNVKLMHKVRILRQEYPAFGRILLGMKYSLTSPHKIVSLGPHKSIQLWVNYDPENWRRKVLKHNFYEVMDIDENASDPDEAASKERSNEKCKTKKNEKCEKSSKKCKKKELKRALDTTKKNVKEAVSGKVHFRNEDNEDDEDDPEEDRYTFDSFLVKDSSEDECEKLSEKSYEPRSKKLKNKATWKQHSDDDEDDVVVRTVKDGKQRPAHKKAQSKPETVTSSVHGRKGQAAKQKPKSKQHSNDEDEDVNEIANKIEATPRKKVQTNPEASTSKDLKSKGQVVKKQGVHIDVRKNGTQSEEDIKIVKEVKNSRILEEIAGKILLKPMAQSTLDFQKSILTYTKPRTIEMPENFVTAREIVKAHYPYRWDELVGPLLPGRSVSSLDKSKIDRLVKEDTKTITVGSVTMHPFILKEGQATKIMLYQKREKDSGYIIIEGREIQHLLSAFSEVQHGCARVAVQTQFKKRIESRKTEMKNYVLELKHLQDRQKWEFKTGSQKNVIERQFELNHLQHNVRKLATEIQELEQEQKQAESIIDFNSGESNEMYCSSENIVMLRLD